MATRNPMFTRPQLALLIDTAAENCRGKLPAGITGVTIEQAKDACMDRELPVPLRADKSKHPFVLAVLLASRVSTPPMTMVLAFEQAVEHARVNGMLVETPKV